MVISQLSTEKQILEAAKKVFVHKGMAAARMEEIAREAGINKALLHYYFRSKENLFRAVFAEAFNSFIPHIAEYISQEKPTIEKFVDVFVENYINLILENPFIPNFVISEINRDPENLINFFQEYVGDKPLVFSSIFQEAVKKGEMRSIDPREFLMNMIGLCIFPFIARPILQKIFFSDNGELYDQFLNRRKTTIKEFILHSIKP